MAAVERMAVAYETWNYKSVLDDAYLQGRFDAMEHDLVELRVARPTLAASVLFSLDDVERPDDVVRVCLTVVPTEPTRTYALLSYLPHDAALARAALSRLLNSEGGYQKYELSKRILNHAQNFVLAPAFVASWSASRLATISDLFRRTIFHNELDFDDPCLTLFE